MFNILLVLSLALTAIAGPTYIPPPSYILSSLSRPADGQISFKLTASQGTYDIGALYAIGGAPCTGTYDPLTIPTTWQPCAETKGTKWRFTKNSTDYLETLNVYAREKDPDYYDIISPYSPDISINVGSFELPEEKSFTEEYAHIFGERSGRNYELSPIKLSAFEIYSAHSNAMSSDTKWCQSALKFNMTDPNAVSSILSGPAPSESSGQSCSTFNSGCYYDKVESMKPAICGYRFAKKPAYSFAVAPVKGLSEFNLTLTENYRVAADPASTMSEFDLLVSYEKHIKGDVDLEVSPIQFPSCKYAPCGYHSGNGTLEMPVVDMKLV